MIEYAVLIGILGIALVSGLTLVENHIYTLLNNIAAALTNAGG